MSELHAGLEAILSTFETLDMNIAFDYDHDLSESTADPAYQISFGIEYDIFGALSSGKDHEGHKRERGGERPD